MVNFIELFQEEIGKIEARNFTNKFFPIKSGYYIYQKCKGFNFFSILFF